MKTFLLIAAASAVLCLSCARTPGTATPKPAAQPGPVTEKGWESSGGSGVACYENDRLVRVVTLDYWDWEQKFHYDSTDADAALGKVSALFESYAPIFFSRYRLVQTRTEFADWKKSGTLPVIEDRHPQRPLDPGCRLVQLAIRHTRSTPGKFPELWLEIDRELGAKLDPLNRAFLVLHEQLYLLGKGMRAEHGNSDAIRWLTARLLSREWAETLPKLTVSQRARTVQNLLVLYFTDYYLVFIDDPLVHPAYSPIPGTPYHRYLAFGELLRKMRDRQARCLAAGGYEKADEKNKKGIATQCYYSLFTDNTLFDSLNEEEAFLWVTRWVYGADDTIENAENLVRFDPIDPRKVDPAQQADLQRACEALDDYQAQFVQKPYAKAHAYCEQLGLSKPSIESLHCQDAKNEVTLRRERNGTYSVRLHSDDTDVNETGLVCLRTREPFLQLACERGGFQLLGMDDTRIDPDSDARTETREIAWGDLRTRWAFPPSGACEIN